MGSAGAGAGAGRLLLALWVLLTSSWRIISQGHSSNFVAVLFLLSKGSPVGWNRSGAFVDLTFGGESILQVSKDAGTAVIYFRTHDPTSVGGTAPHDLWRGMMRLTIAICFA